MTTAMVMHDGDVRLAIHRELATRPDTGLVIDELGLCGTVRVDVATVNDALTGYELKSASDTLRRLPTQVEYYSKVLDYSVLVVAENHLGAARDILRPHWGITVAISDQAGEVRLEVERESSMSPDVDAASLAQLIWRDETLAALEARGAARGLRSKPRAALWAALVTIATVDEIRQLVRERLVARREAAS